MIMDNKTKGELTYESLLLRDDINKMLVEHPFFRRNFIHQYDSMSYDGKIPVEVNININGISIQAHQNLPDATNGIYHGYKDMKTCTFGLEKQAEHMEQLYLCVRKDSCYVYSHDKNDHASYAKQLEVYDDREQLGVSYAQNSREGNKGMNAYLDPYIPEISVASALMGGKDTNVVSYLQNHTGNSNFQCVSSGRKAGEGIVTTSEFSRCDGKYKDSLGYGLVNLERPQYLHNRGMDFVRYDMSGIQKLAFLDSKYATPEEALYNMREYYKNAVSSNNRGR